MLQQLKLSYGVILCLCLSSLLFAYGAQYFFDMQPCHLCYFQRYAYMGAAVASALSINTFNRPLRLLFGSITTLILVTGLVISAYHMAVERGWVEPPHSCLNAIMDGNTLEEVKYEILHEKNVPCNVVSFRFLGLSMTEWSLLLFLGLCLISLSSLFSLWKKDSL